MLVNEVRLSSLREEIGEDGYAEVVDLFLAESEEVIARLQAGQLVAPLEAELHFLKGVALNLGFDDLAEMCRRGERGEGFDPQAMARLYSQTRVALAGFAPA
jgi:HPt (histidine-containing phosphotransfer) domain-containing protein